MIGAPSARDSAERSCVSAGTSCTSMRSPKRSDTQLGSLRDAESTTTSATAGRDHREDLLALELARHDEREPRVRHLATATTPPSIANGLREPPVRASFATSRAHGILRTVGSASMASSSSAALSRSPAYQSARPRSPCASDVWHALGQREAPVKSRRASASARRGDAASVVLRREAEHLLGRGASRRRSRRPCSWLARGRATSARAAACAAWTLDVGPQATATRRVQNASDRAGHVSRGDGSTRRMRSARSSRRPRPGSR